MTEFFGQFPFSQEEENAAKRAATAAIQGHLTAIGFDLQALFHERLGKVFTSKFHQKRDFVNGAVFGFGKRFSGSQAKLGSIV